MKRTEGVSTTDIVGRLLLLTRSPHPLTTAPSSTVATAAGACASAISADASGAAADGAGTYVSSNISSSGVSQFLPTTLRLRAFSSGRTPRVGERVVYIDGAFDMLHAGHIQARRREGGSH